MDDTFPAERTKVCSKCKVDKSVEAFSLNSRRKDGRSPWCKSCCRAYYLSDKPPGYTPRQYPKQRNRLGPDINEKRCARCGIVKSVDEYPRDARAPDGRVKRCRDC